MYPQVKYTAGSLMLSCFSARGPGDLVQMHGIIYSIKYQQITNLNLTASVRNLIMGHGCIFHQDNNPKQTSKSIQKWVTEHKINLLHLSKATYSAFRIYIFCQYVSCVFPGN